MSAIATATALPLVLADVTVVRRGQRLLDVASLRIDGGGRTLLLGPNGAGKSLLMRVCDGLLEPTTGRVRWGGIAMLDAPRRRRLAMVFQHPVLLRRSTLGNMMHALSVHGVPWRRRGVVAREALALFSLQHLARRPARVLSGGEQQRLALARAWALAPEIVFLDEPTSALDPTSTQAVEQAVERFREAGVTVVMASHDLAQARRLADSVIFMCGGVPLEHTPAETFFTRPRTREAAAFLRGDLVTGPFPRLVEPQEDPCEPEETGASRR